MKLFRTSAYNSLAVATKIGTSLLLSKVLAVYLGPSGFAAIGQFQNIVTLANAGASGGLAVGITKHTAQSAGDLKRLHTVWVTAALLTLGWVLVSVAAVVLARSYLAAWALPDPSLTVVLDWLAISMFFGAANGLMLAILNGRKAIAPYVVSSILGNVASAALAVILVVTSGLKGALVALAIGQALSCIFTFAVFRKHVSIERVFQWRLFDSTVARGLSKYSLMFATSAVVVPLSQIQIRKHIVRTLGWQDAGLWQALTRISETHLLLLTTTLSLYFLPRFAEIDKSSELQAEVGQGYRFLLPVVSMTCVVIFVLRRPIISLLLSADFLPLADILWIQLAGDFLKIGSWLFAVTMLSHARTRSFVVTEIVFAVILVGSTMVLTSHYGLPGTAAAYALTYALYWVVTGFLFYQLTRTLEPELRHAGQPSNSSNQG